MLIARDEIRRFRTMLRTGDFTSHSSMCCLVGYYSINISNTWRKFRCDEIYKPGHKHCSPVRMFFFFASAPWNILIFSSSIIVCCTRIIHGLSETVSASQHTPAV